jgi:hypothetical protein
MPERRPKKGRRKGESWPGAGPAMVYRKAPMSDGSHATLVVLNETPLVEQHRRDIMSDLILMQDIPRDGKFHFHRTSTNPRAQTKGIRQMYPYYMDLGPGLHMAYQSYDTAIMDGQGPMQRWIDPELGVPYSKIFVMRDPL